MQHSAHLLPSIRTAAKLASLTLLVLIALALLSSTCCWCLSVITATKESVLADILGTSLKITPLSSCIAVSAASMPCVLACFVFHAALIKRPRSRKEPIRTTSIGGVVTRLNRFWLTSFGENRIVNFR